MKVLDGALHGLLVIEPDVFKDKRGFFVETFHEKRYRESGIDAVFVQDNLSYSFLGTLRGLHYQHRHAQGKLIQVLSGEILDAAVDIRIGSPTFGQSMGVRLSDENKRQLYIPQGFAHGFCVLSDTALVMYKCTDFYAPDSERGILWSDGDLGIEWPIEEPIVSDKDSHYPLLKDISPDFLPSYYV